MVYLKVSAVTGVFDGGEKRNPGATSASSPGRARPRFPRAAWLGSLAALSLQQQAAAGTGGSSRGQETHRSSAQTQRRRDPASTGPWETARRCGCAPATARWCPALWPRIPVAASWARCPVVVLAAPADVIRNCIASTHHLPRRTMLADPVACRSAPNRVRVPAVHWWMSTTCMACGPAKPHPAG